ncbi:hypothetical protein [Streptomyces sp. NPDC001508]|uniref:hypothetical protein n=1 Tax=Streptomyces sp. NPDC001508 TaxID=3154656 RepID=UPI003324E762
MATRLLGVPRCPGSVTRVLSGGNPSSDGRWQTFALPDPVDIRDIDALSANDACATGMRYPVDGATR